MVTDCITQADTGLTALAADGLDLAALDDSSTIERLRAERDTEEACARLHAGLLREVALALGNEPGDDRSKLPERVRELRSKLDRAPVALMDTRVALGLCAMTESDFPALHALQGRRVALVDLGPNVADKRHAAPEER